LRRALVAAALLCAACRPDFGVPVSSVTAPRIAAVRFDPPEAPPGARVTATAFVVAPDGARMPPIDWSLCLTPKSTTNNDVVDPTCLQPGGTAAIATTAAPQALTLPSDACRRSGWREFVARPPARRRRSPPSSPPNTRRTPTRR
jgi:hypothetical protein